MAWRKCIITRSWHLPPRTFQCWLKFLAGNAAPESGVFCQGRVNRNCGVFFSERSRFFFSGVTGSSNGFQSDFYEIPCVWISSYGGLLLRRKYCRIIASAATTRKNEYRCPQCSTSDTLSHGRFWRTERSKLCISVQSAQFVSVGIRLLVRRCLLSGFSFQWHPRLTPGDSEHFFRLHLDRPLYRLVISSSCVCSLR